MALLLNTHFVDDRVKPGLINPSESASPLRPFPVVFPTSTGICFSIGLQLHGGIATPRRNHPCRFCTTTILT